MQTTTFSKAILLLHAHDNPSGLRRAHRVASGWDNRTHCDEFLSWGLPEKFPGRWPNRSLVRMRPAWLVLHFREVAEYWCECNQLVLHSQVGPAISPDPLS